MSATKRGYFPISEANTDKIRFALELPRYVDNNRIGVNLRNIELLCRIGGISHLRVVGMSDDEISRTFPTIIGFNQRGEALAGAAKSTQAVLYKSESETNRGFLYHESSWEDLTIAINMSEVGQQIAGSRDKKSGLYSVQAWSNYLNKCVKDGIVNEGVQFLTLGMSKQNRIYAVLMNGILMPSSFLLGGDIKHAPYAIAGWAIAKGMTKLYSNAHGDDWRFSIPFESQFDRAILLWVVSQPKRVIKTIT